MKKYYVIITKWDYKEKKQVEKVAGEFDNYMYANIFNKAYEEEFKSSPRIVEVKL